MKKCEISVIIPCYNCSKTLSELYKRLKNTLIKISKNYEIIFVNDASPSNDWSIIKKLSVMDKKVIGLNLSKNFGQHQAVTAGLKYCAGRWVVVMDGDLQDQPEEIIKMYKKAQEGYDVVVGIREKRKDKFVKKILSRLFYIIFNYLTGTKIYNNIGNYGVYNRKVIDAVNSMKEQSRSFGLFVIWLGFNRIEIEIEHGKRLKGKSSYSFSRMLSLAFDSIIAHSNKLLKITIKIGFIMAFFSFIYSFYLIMNYLLYGISVTGWTSIIVSLFLLSGLIIIAIGVVGIYVGKVFDEVKNRPLFIVSEKINIK